MGSRAVRARRAPVVLTSAALVMSSVLVWTQAPAGADHMAGVFEAHDGNLVDGGSIDWQGCHTAEAAGSADTDLFVGFDEPTGQGDDSLVQGTKDDDSLVIIERGSIPNNKSNLLRAYVCGLESANGTEHLAVGWIRSNTLGSANISVELNQVASAPLPVQGEWRINRTAGDALFQFNFSGNGGVQVLLSKWVTSGNARTSCEANSTVPCWGKKVDLTSSGAADGSVNGIQVTDPIVGHFPDEASPEHVSNLASSTFGEFVVDLEAAGLLAPCKVFNRVTVSSRASAAFNAAKKDLIRPFDVLISTDVDDTGSSASGSATPLTIRYAGADYSPIPTRASSSAPAGGRSVTDSQSFAVVDVPASGSGKGNQVHAGLGEAHTRSTLDAAVPSAEHTSVAEVTNLNVLNGVVTASVVRGTAHALARSSFASHDSLTPLESVFEDLRIDADGVGPGAPQVYESVAPNTRIDLSPIAFGAGSYVALRAESGSVIAPPPGTKLGEAVTFAATRQTRMIHVHVTDADPITPNSQTLDVIVSEADAAASLPTTLCAPAQAVSGDAFIVKEATNPAAAPLTVGSIAIPSTGGHARQALLSVSTPLVRAGAAETDSVGTFAVNEYGNPVSVMDAVTFAQLAGLCVSDGLLGCLVSADLVRSQAHAASGATSRSADAVGTQLLNVRVAGAPPMSNPAPNTEIPIDLDGDGSHELLVILNKQVCDNGAKIANVGADYRVCDEGANGHAGLTVTAIEVVILEAGTPLGGGPLASISIARAHADATFLAPAGGGSGGGGSGGGGGTKGGGKK